MVSQAVIYGVPSIFVLFLWAAVTTNVVPVMVYGPDCPCFRNAVLYAPVWFVAALGIYAVFSVVYGVATFNDCDDARQELVAEIVEARKDLKAKKVI